MRKTILILGVVLAIIAAGAVFLFLQLTRPVVVEVPVATTDIPIGSVLKAEQFRVSRMSNVDPQTLSKWVTLADWRQVEGKVATSDIRAGFPIARAQVDPNSTNAVETRLSRALTGTNDYYVVIPAKPDEVGNYVQPGDRIDMILNLGEADESAELTVAVTQTEATAAEEVTQTTQMPISKLVMQNMTVLRVDRERARTQTTNQQTQQQETANPNDVMRLYVKVDRDQLEVLSFVLNNGRHTLAVRAASGSEARLPTDGVTWDDFARWFYSQRGNRADGAQPFDVVNQAAEPSAAPAESAEPGK